MNSVNKTLYIPLYGKSYVSKRNLILQDPKAEEIWTAEGFALKGKSASKWLAFYMSMRAYVFDRWLKDRMLAMPDATVLHLGCGMDSRICRVGTAGHMWYDVDFPEVIETRRRYYPETEHYHMIGSDVCAPDYLKRIKGNCAIIVMEGISMYLPQENLLRLLNSLNERFERVDLLMDCYSEFAAKASKYKNPINDVGVTRVYGLDDPTQLETGDFQFLRELEMTPQDLIDQLQGMEKRIFRKLYAGSIAKKMYRLYEFSSGKEKA